MVCGSFFDVFPLSCLFALMVVRAIVFWLCLCWGVLGLVLCFVECCTVSSFGIEGGFGLLLLVVLGGAGVWGLGWIGV